MSLCQVKLIVSAKSESEQLSKLGTTECQLCAAGLEMSLSITFCERFYVDRRFTKRYVECSL
ncbi:hypothetical protein DEO72_LG2g3532 [Vigna unguiculata]|uniref:Uncharacterized protein n=1 Tax=Vigna unguiculata TaxID=3917 RepID=A0A4D6L3W8_VIGUN|nr:hypothetical protein DEO72_LG2g3532 [Vigna unguiculata]